MKRIFSGALLLALSLFTSALSAQFSVDMEHDQGPGLLITELGDLSIHSGESAQLGGEVIVSGGNEPYVFSWEPSESLDDPGISNPAATPTGTTVYTLTVVDANNCSAIAEQLLTVNNASGLFEKTENDNIRIFPNPCIGSFHVQVEKAGWNASLSIQIFSLTGQLILEDELGLTDGGNYGPVVLLSSSPGTYLIKIVSGDITYRQLIINQ